MGHGAACFLPYLLFSSCPANPRWFLPPIIPCLVKLENIDCWVNWLIISLTLTLTLTQIFFLSRHPKLKISMLCWIKEKFPSFGVNQWFFISFSQLILLQIVTFLFFMCVCVGCSVTPITIQDVGFHHSSRCVATGGGHSPALRWGLYLRHRTLRSWWLFWQSVSCMPLPRGNAFLSRHNFGTHHNIYFVQYFLFPRGFLYGGGWHFYFFLGGHFAIVSLQQAQVTAPSKYLLYWRIHAFCDWLQKHLAAGI